MAHVSTSSALLYLSFAMSEAQVTIIQGDSRKALRDVPDRMVQTCVTSPPYFGLRDYGVDGQLGLEETPEAYVQKMVEVFREVRRVLRDDGTLWLNLGDSYWGGKGSNGSSKARRTANKRGYTPSGGTVLMNTRPADGKHDTIKPKDLVGIPWRVAFALQTDGWYLRQDIIWHKPNPMPESVRDRCTKAHEYIFLFSKSPRYYFDADAIKEPVKDASLLRTAAPAGVRFGGNKAEDYGVRTKSGKQWLPSQGGGGTGFVGHSGNRKADGTLYLTRNRRSVWTVTAKPYKDAHFATFPPDLIEPCILAGAPKGGTVLDPFFGAGTTGLVARRHGRHCIGIELNPDYIKLARARLKTVAPPQPALIAAE